MGEFIINLIDKLIGTKGYRVVIEYYRFPRLVKTFDTHKEAMDYWNHKVEGSDYKSMELSRITKHSSHMKLLIIKW